MLYRWIAGALKEYETSSEFDEVFILRMLEVRRYITKNVVMLLGYSNMGFFFLLLSFFVTGLVPFTHGV